MMPIDQVVQVINLFKNSCRRDKGRALMKVLVAFWLPMLLIVASNVIYHCSQKTIPQALSPPISMLVSYAVAGVITLAMLPLFSQPLDAAAFRHVNVSSVLVGIAIVGVELGFLLAYRHGWALNVASLTSSTVLAVLLVFIGNMVFNEGWSAQRMVGVILSLAGLFLLNF